MIQYRDVCNCMVYIVYLLVYMYIHTYTYIYKRAIRITAVAYIGVYI